MRNIIFGDTTGWLPQLLAAFDEFDINAEWRCSRRLYFRGAL